MSEAYIAGALVHLDKKHWEFYERLGKVVEDFGLKVWIPHIHTSEGLDVHDDELDPVHVFNTDISVVKNAKLVVAEVTHPGTGTGIEIGTALNLNKPIICLAQKDAKLTRMVRGPARLGLLELIRYENQEDALSQLKDLLETKFRKLIL